MNNLQSKVIAETITVLFDFGNQLLPGDTLSSPTVDSSVFQGTDPDPDAIVFGSATVSGKVVTQKIIAGLGGVVYNLICSVTGTSGAIYKVVQQLAVLTNDGDFAPGIPLSIDGTLPANACINEDFYFELPILGGVPPYGPVSILSGNFPDNYNLEVVGSNIVISGTDPTADVYTFTIHLLDNALNTADSPQEITLIDCSGPPVSVSFFAVGVAGVASQSPDGKVWSAVTTGSTAELRGAAFGLGLFVIVGNQEIRTSPDLITWTARTVPALGSGQKFKFVTFGDADVGFIAGTGPGGVGNGKIVHSPDGINWSLVTLPSVVGNLLCGVFKAGVGFIVGTGTTAGKFLQSVDGVTWTKSTYGTSHNGICDGNGVFLSVGSTYGAGGETWSSGDGYTWTHLSTQGGISYGFPDVAWSGTIYFAAVSADPSFGGAWTSSDGVVWVQISGFGNTLTYCTVFGDTVYLLGSSGSVLYSTDGITFASYSLGANFAGRICYDIITFS